MKVKNSLRGIGGGDDPKGISYDDDDDITEVVPNNQKKQKKYYQESTQNNESKTCEKCGSIMKKNDIFIVIIVCFFIFRASGMVVSQVNRLSFFRKTIFDVFLPFSAKESGLIHCCYKLLRPITPKIIFV
ncbi:hypothetical protein BpHYR1_045450 [Brachionus plicatilis]|uniref:Uncharacterized protein n=1 Tax=Brachionus plicatilis TaxID=10195 RepID=A0A3M7T481_BRAPC|nr:hypothetical protein BpHYR1_045450 [Brachionus plicatilis]